MSDRYEEFRRRNRCEGNRPERRFSSQTRENYTRHRNSTGKKRKIKKGITIPRKWKARILALIFAGAIVGGATSYIRSSNKEHNEEVGISITEQLKDEASKSIMDGIEFDPETGEYYSSETVAIMPELSKVLHSSDIDEKLDEYYSNQKEGELNLSSSQIIDLSFNMMKALIADGMNINIDDVRITYVDTGMTATVNVQAGRDRMQSYAGMGNNNYSQINKDLSELIRKLCLYKDDSRSVSKKEALKLYEDIKLIANEYKMQLSDGKLILESREDGNKYLYDRTGEHSKMEDDGR